MFLPISHSMEICRMAWHSPKIIFLEMGPNNVIGGGESENRGPGARVRVVYVVANVVLENSKIVKTSICQVWYQTLRLDEINNFHRQHFPIRCLHKKFWAEKCQNWSIFRHFRSVRS